MNNVVPHNFNLNSNSSTATQVLSTPQRVVVCRPRLIDGATIVRGKDQQGVFLGAMEKQMEPQMENEMITGLPQTYTGIQAQFSEDTSVCHICMLRQLDCMSWQTSFPHALGLESIREILDGVI